MSHFRNHVLTALLAGSVALGCNSLLGNKTTHLDTAGSGNLDSAGSAGEDTQSEGGGAGHAVNGGAGGAAGAVGGSHAGGMPATGGAAGAGTSGAAGVGGVGGVGGALPPAPCGNGTLDTGESCDDGNTTSGDGCNATCHPENGWLCDQAQTPHCKAVCGDGLVVGDEALAGGCDDNNNLSGDGCSAACKVEASYVCSGAPSVCAKTCGDGKLDTGETCDDKNTLKGDGCFACAVEAGYTCDSAAPSKCTDINECSSGAPCGANSTCANTVGSYTCGCVTGYQLVGSTCTDINECASNPCGANAACANTPGSYTCSCKAGYSGNGQTCVRTSCAGMTGTECQGGDCCASPTVTGTTTPLSFKIGGSFGTTTATIDSFALDKYEVTVGRFRKFVAQYTGHPANGAGAHPLIAGSGWQSPAWDASIEASASDLASALKPPGPFGPVPFPTWDATGANDKLPINCISWYQAFAFCAWDGGRLPTEAEWEYAAAGGTSELSYAWGNAPALSGAQDSTAAYANYYGLGDGSAPNVQAFADILAVGSKPAGVGKYGQMDLTGSMLEWNLDVYATLPAQCSNCAQLAAGNSRSIRGGGWDQSQNFMSITLRGGGIPRSPGANNYGIRCARSL